MVREILTGIDDLSFVYLSSRDVVRHKIVQDIVEPTGATTRPGRSGPRTPASARGPSGSGRPGMSVFLANEQADYRVDEPA